MIYIIGSGPAGISTASALLKRGCKVTLIDAGVTLPEDKQTILAELKKNWEPHQLKHLKQQLNPKTFRKLAYNSNYPYESVDEHFNLISDRNIECLPSFAQGGLSNVWGAVIKDYHDDDFKHWPIKAKEMQKYYDKARKLINYQSELKENYLSKQAICLHEKMETNHLNLKQNGIRFAVPELAVNFKNHCRFCGMCHHGCPLSLIYSAEQTLQKLLLHPHFKYLNHLIVKTIKEDQAKIIITTTHRLNKDHQTFIGSQVFVACGAILSPYFYLSHHTINHKEIDIYDSTHFMLPCLMHHSIKEADRVQSHSLCQLSLAINHPNLLNDVVMQIYTYMDFYNDTLTNRFKKIPFTSSLKKYLLNRLIVIQGFLHSDDSHRIKMKILKDNTIQLSLQNNQSTNKKVKLLLHQLKENSNLLNFSPLSFLSKISKGLKSFHYGGSLPMQLSPGSNQTDIYGKPHGFKRWHFVDATIFPTIPAGPITLTIMANAYRIASECHIYE